MASGEIFNVWFPGNQIFSYNDGVTRTLTTLTTPTGTITGERFSIPNREAGFGITFDMIQPPLQITKPPKICYSSDKACLFGIKDSEGWLWAAPMPVQELCKERGWEWAQFSLAEVQDDSKASETAPEFPSAGFIQAFQFYGAQDVHGDVNNQQPVVISIAYIAGRSPKAATTGNIRSFQLRVRSPQAHQLKVGDVRLVRGSRNELRYLGTLPFGYMEGGPGRSAVSNAPYRGPFLAGYQSGTPWVDLKNESMLSSMLDFMLDAQNEFRNRHPGNLFGPFMHCFLPETWDSEQTGQPNTWVWDAPDGNPSWSGWQYRAFDGMAHTFYEAFKNESAVVLKAKQVSENFLNWIYTWMRNNPQAPGVPNNWAPPGWEVGLPFPAGSYLDPKYSGEPISHDIALVLKGAVFCALAGSPIDMCKYVIKRCVDMLWEAQVRSTTHPMEGSFPANPMSLDFDNPATLWMNFGFHIGEILDALALLYQNPDLYEEELVPEPEVKTTGQIWSNYGTTSLADPITVNSTEIVLRDASRFPLPEDDEFFLITIDDRTRYEIIKVGEREGNVLKNIVRGWEGTQIQSFEPGTLVEVRVTKDTLFSFHQEFPFNLTETFEADLARG